MPPTTTKPHVQDPNTPRYDRATGLLTDYGKSLGLKEVNAPKNGSTVITSNDLQPTRESILPNKPVSTYGGLDGAINGLISGAKSASELARDDAKNSMDTSAVDYINAIIDSGKISSSVDRTEQDAAKKRSDNYLSQIEQEALSNRRKIENLQKTNSTGMTSQALAIETERINRDSLSKQADLAILQTAANRDYETAAAIADRKVELLMEESRARIDGLKFFFDYNKDYFSTQDKRLYDEKIKEEERAYNKAEKETTTITNLGLQIAQNQAPANITTKALNAKSVAELMAIPGISKYLQSPLERLQMQKYSLDIKKANAELKEIMSQSAADGLTKSQREDILKNPTAVRAAARIGVIKSVEAYNQAFKEYLKNGEKEGDRSKLNTMLNTTVGSAINVAQGQGAMGDDEAKRILGNLKVTRFGNIGRRIPNAAQGIIDAQNTLYETDINFVESAIPGTRTQYQLFADYERSKTDPLLITSSQYGENRLNLD